MEGVAYVAHGAVEEGGFGTEAVVDADGEEARVEEGLGLLWADVFAGKHHVASAVDHEGWGVTLAFHRCREGMVSPTGRDVLGSPSSSG